MVHETYDYAIIGAGAAGLHLSLAMMNHSFFENKKVLILEKDDKSTNDKTYSYWEQGNGHWDHITYQVWKKGIVHDGQKEISLSLGNYRYKSIRALDFYNHCKKKILGNNNFVWKNEDVLDVHSADQPTIKTRQNEYQTTHVFDSRIPISFYQKPDSFLRVLQHFKGWVIQTDQPIFKPDTFTMMDFRVKYKDQTFFTYVLPQNKFTALIEATFFSSNVVPDNDYDQLLNTYIEEILGLTTYTIVETEKGIIPMSNFPFHKENIDGITKIGTAGGWVKPSSGYAFKNIERNAKKTCENIAMNNPITKDIGSWKFRKYDTLFLEILQNQNHLGTDLFKELYQNAPAHLIFKFLDEQTNIREDLGIILSLPSSPFLKALWKHI